VGGTLVFAHTKIYFFFFVFKAIINNTNTPMLQCHGIEDPVIYFKWGKLLADQLSKVNSKFEFKTYEGLMHAVNDQVTCFAV
jgi:lysophospholipase-2